MGPDPPESETRAGDRPSPTGPAKGTERIPCSEPVVRGDPEPPEETDFDSNELPAGSPTRPPSAYDDGTTSPPELFSGIASRSFDLRPTMLASRRRRTALSSVILSLSLVFAVLWILAIVVYRLELQSPYPIVAFALITLPLMGPAGYWWWLLWTNRPGTFPVSILVQPAGFTLQYRSGAEWTANWGDDRTSIWITDVTGSDLYPSWVPSGYYLGEPSTWFGQIWMTEEAFNALVESARRAGARVERRERPESRSPLRSVDNLYAGTVVWHISGPRRA